MSSSSSINSPNLRQFFETIDQLRKNVVRAPRVAGFGPIVTGFGGIDAGLAYVGASSLLNLASVRVVVSPEDALQITRTMLDDGMVAIDVYPNADEGISVSMSTSCEMTATELACAFRDAGDHLAARLARGEVVGGTLADMEVAGAA